MTKHTSRPATPRKGNVAIEFAITLPIWIAVILAIAEFGWLFFRYTTLDAAADLGCRAGSLIDPGEDDTHIARVQQRATERMVGVLLGLGWEECDTCTVEAWTVGAPPSRSLMCRATQHFEPIVGLYVDEMDFSSIQVARLEWQREVAP